MDISLYEPLNDRPTPQVVTPYEELNDDFRKQTFPVSVKQTAATQDQPISDTSYEQVRTQTRETGSSECSKMSHVVGLLDNDQSKDTTHCISSSSSYVNCAMPNDVANPPILPFYLPLLDETPPVQGNEYDIMNDYEQIHVDYEQMTTDEQPHSTNSPTNRPLPLTPLSIYEPLNKPTNVRNSNARNVVVSRRKCILVGKIVLMLIGIVALVATGVVITKVVLTKGDDHKGKLGCFKLFGLTILNNIEV